MIEKVLHKYLPRFILFAFLALLTILFFLGGPDFNSSRSFKAFWNTGHILYYALLPYAIFSLPSKKSAWPAIQIVVSLGLALILGIIVELVQSNFQRTPDAGDILRNIIGALGGIFFLLPARKNISPRPLHLLQTAAILLAATQIYPIAAALTDEHLAARQFPLLSGFETPYEIQRWRGDCEFSIDDTVAASGRHAMRITMNTALYSGVNLHYFQENWSGYQWLQILAFNPSSKSLMITCRIHDRSHTQGTQPYEDRFNQQIRLTHGWNTILIDLAEVKNAPAHRQMDMQHIHGLGLFASALAHPVTIYIDDILLK